jgi:hypothetical protein
MALSTAKKVRFLQEYISEWAEKLMDIHYDNITGIRIDKKSVQGHEKTQYAIVFQVKNKIDKDELKDSEVVPDYFDILFPDGITRRIKTDIEETGPIQLQANIGDSVACPDYSFGAGSMGVFVNDFFEKTFAVTNYHVVAKRLCNNGIFFFQRDQNDLRLNVTIQGNNGSIKGMFERGTVNRDVDVAFVAVERTGAIKNLLPGMNTLNGVWSREKVMTSLQGKRIRIFALHSNGRSANVRSANMPLNYPNSTIAMTGLIKLDAVITQPGDSGGLAVDDLNSVVGIVLGADSGTYIIPFYKISEFKNCYPI